ncbi:MAG: DUF4169 family protein [Rhodospirillales bacterium]
MPAKVINLRKARKAKQRQNRETEAASNRAKHGQPAALRRVAEKQEEMTQKRHESHRLPRTDEPD